MINKKPFLFKEDEELFKRMEGHYQSDNERKFFETQRYKQEYMPVGTQDILLLEDMNEDGIYFIREGFGEYFIGSLSEDSDQIHTMKLSDALNSNLKDAGIISRNLTLWEWLRERDYKGICYDYNLDERE